MAKICFSLILSF